MAEPTPQQRAAAAALDVSLAFADTPVTVARLVELVEELRCRVQALEEQKRSWLSRK